MYKKVLILLFLITSAFSSYAQEAIPTKGKEFWLSFMRNYIFAPGEELRIFVTSDISTTGNVSLPLIGYSEDFVVTANVTTTLIIPNNIGEELNTEVISQKGIFIETQDTVSVFAINYQVYSADGSKVLPIQSIGTNYRISSYPGAGNGVTAASEFLIVATEDNTEIEINLTTPTFPVFPLIVGTPANIPYTITLNRGETYQVLADPLDNGLGDFTGTTIRATEASGSCRPFAVFSGTACAEVTPGCIACDHLFDQNFDVSTWGTEYYVVPNQSTGNYTVRVLADQNNTNVSINGTNNFTLQAGEFQEFNHIDYPLCVSSDQPVSTTQYFQGTGCSDDGDPAMLILNDNTQKIDNITFTTVESDQITDHGLNIICNSVDIGTVLLDGVPLSPTLFSPFLACANISYAQLLITEGSHTLISPNGFTAYVFGSGDGESYAYSVGSFLPGQEIVEFVDEVFCSDTEILLETNPLLTDINWFLDNDPETTLETDTEYLLTLPIVSGLYHSTGINPFSGCNENHSYLVEITDPPIITTTDFEICKHESIQFENIIDQTSGYFEYLWTPATGLSATNIFNPIASPTENTTYSLTVSSPTGCSSPVTATVEVIVQGGAFSGITISATPDLVCEGDEIQLLGTINEIIIEDNFDPNISWGNWCNMSNGSPSFGCGSVNNNALHFNGTGIRSCTSNGIDISTGGNISFAIKFGSAVFPCDDNEVGDDVVLEYSTSGCEGSYTVIQTFLEFAYPNFTQLVIPVPIGAQGPNTFFRWRQLNNSGGNTDNWMLDDVYISIFDTSNFSTEWTSAENITNPNSVTSTSNPIASNYYYLDITEDLYDCVYSDSIYVNVVPGIEYDMVEEYIYCSPTLINLNPNVSSSGNYEYTWNSSDGSVSNYINPFLIVEPSSSVNYTLEISDDIEICQDTIEITVIINEITGINLATNSNIICYGDTSQIDLTINGVSTNSSIEWTSVEDFIQINNNSIYSSNITSSIYNVEVEDIESGCTFNESIEITVSDLFSIDGLTDIASCNAVTVTQEVISTGIPENDLIWSWIPQTGLNNYNSPTITITENNNIEYTVTATDEYNCIQTDSFTIEILPTEFDFGVDEFLLCLGDTFLLETGYDELLNNFLWSTGAETSAIEITSAGMYDVQISSDLGCNTSDAVSISYHENPEISLGMDQDACDDDEIDLTTGPVSEDILWNTGVTSESITITQGGCYSVELTNEYGCSKADTICYTYYQNPLICLEDSLFECAGETITLNACNDGIEFEWNTEETTQIIAVTEPGIYSVTVTNQYDCSTTDQITVDYGESPYVFLPEDIILCEGQIAEVTVDTNADYILWNTGENDSTITISQSGAYIVTGYNQFCQTQNQINVIVNQYINTTFPEDTTICFDDFTNGFLLSPGYGGTLYEWSTGETSPTIQVTEPGFYLVEVSTQFGCVSTESIFIKEFCLNQTLFAPDAFTPNNDGDNDTFFVKGYNIAQFELIIHDRWGIVVWKTDDINKAWDGSYFNGGYYGDSDVYDYIINYTYYIDKTGNQTESNTKRGRITLIR